MEELPWCDGFRVEDKYCGVCGMDGGHEYTDGLGGYVVQGGGTHGEYGKY